MTASMISVDAQTTDFVPTNDYINVRVDAAVKVRIATDDDTLFKAATRNFLYKTTSEISEEVRDTLEGHLRAIIGQMKLTDIITDRAASPSASRRTRSRTWRRWVLRSLPSTSRT